MAPIFGRAVPVVVLLLGAVACEGQHGGASSSAGLGCAQAAPDWCAANPGQPCSWSTYADPTRFDCAHTSLAACGSYDVAIAQRVDAGTVSYYDPATGGLVAVVGYGGAAGPGARSCIAGPAGGFVEPACPSSAFTVGACPGGRACAPDAASCGSAAECCSGSCVQGACCSPPACP